MRGPHSKHPLLWVYRNNIFVSGNVSCCCCFLDMHSGGRLIWIVRRVHTISCEEGPHNITWRKSHSHVKETHTHVEEAHAHEYSTTRIDSTYWNPIVISRWPLDKYPIFILFYILYHTSSAPPPHTMQTHLWCPPANILIQEDILPLEWFLWYFETNQCK